MSFLLLNLFVFFNFPSLWFLDMIFNKKGLKIDTYKFLKYIWSCHIHIWLTCRVDQRYPELQNWRFKVTLTKSNQKSENENYLFGKYQIFKYILNLFCLKKIIIIIFEHFTDIFPNLFHYIRCSFVTRFYSWHKINF